MTYAWNELCYDDFKGFFRGLVDEAPWSKNKVMEVQDPLSIVNGAPEKRIYFGTLIRIYDYPQYNQSSIDGIEAISRLNPQIKQEINNHHTTSLCEFIPEVGIKVSPIYYKQERQLNAIWSTCFGDEDLKDDLIRAIITNPINLWYAKGDDGRVIVDTTGKRYKGSERFIRFRTIDFDPTWKELVELPATAPEFQEYYKDDLKPEQIELRA